MAEDQQPHLQQLTAYGIGILSASERRPLRERKSADSRGLLDEGEEHAMKVDQARSSQDAFGTPDAPTLCVVRMDRRTFGFFFLPFYFNFIFNCIVYFSEIILLAIK